MSDLKTAWRKSGHVHKRRPVGNCRQIKGQGRTPITRTMRSWVSLDGALQHPQNQVQDDGVGRTMGLGNTCKRLVQSFLHTTTQPMFVTQNPS